MTALPFNNDFYPQFRQTIKTDRFLRSQHCFSLALNNTQPHFLLLSFLNIVLPSTYKDPILSLVYFTSPWTTILTPWQPIQPIRTFYDVILPSIKLIDEDKRWPHELMSLICQGSIIQFPCIDWRNYDRYCSPSRARKLKLVWARSRGTASALVVFPL